MNHKNIIEYAIKNKNMLEIYSAQDEGSFDVGIPIALFDEDFVIARISKEGQYNGFCAIRMDDVVLLKKETGYLKQFENLASETEMDTDFECRNAISCVIKYAAMHNLNVEAAFFPPFNSTVYGKCKSFDGDIVEIEELNNKGQADGVTFFEVDDIRSCFCE